MTETNRFEYKRQLNDDDKKHYGCCSTIQVLDKPKLENKTVARITSKEQIESRPYDPKALREAIINAIVHNTYSKRNMTKAHLRLLITS